MKRLPLTHLLAIAGLLAALAAFAWYYTNANDPVEGPAPAGKTEQDIPNTQETCKAAGGFWNECASACPPGAEACIQTCVQKCEFPEPFSDAGAGKVSLYFRRISSDSQNLDCAKVYPVERSVEAMGSEFALLKELVKGVSKQEESDGYATSFPAGVKVLEQRIDGDTFYVDFSGEMRNVAGACRVTAIRSQIEKTIKTLMPEIKKVIITVEGGNPDEALQP